MATAGSIPQGSLQKNPPADFYAKYAINIKRGQVDPKPSINNIINIKDSEDCSDPPKKKFKGMPTTTFSLNRRGTAENPVDLGDLPGFDPVPPFKRLPEPGDITVYMRWGYITKKPEPTVLKEYIRTRRQRVFSF